MRFLTLLIATISLSACVSGGKSAVPMDESISDAKSAMSQNTRIPIRLPSDLPGNSIARVQISTADRYVVEYFPDICEPCHAGFIQAQRLASDDLPQDGQAIQLAGGIQGFYYPPVCGADCTDSEIRWVQDGVVYTISGGEGFEDSIKRLADEAINNGVLNPPGN